MKVPGGLRLGIFHRVSDLMSDLREWIVKLLGGDVQIITMNDVLMRNCL